MSWGPPKIGDRVRRTNVRPEFTKEGSLGSVTDVYTARGGRLLVDVLWDEQERPIWYVWEQEWDLFEAADDPVGSLEARRRSLMKRRNRLVAESTEIEKRITDIDRQLEDL